MPSATIDRSSIQFLKNLKANNDRDWFQANKDRFDKAMEGFVAFVDALIKKISRFDPSISHHLAKDCVFRIYRDIRFSKDKSPYKTHFGAHITSASKKSEIHSRAGYYIHLEPGASMLAGGAYQPPSDWLKKIRQDISYNTKEFKKIIQGKSFKDYFGELEGEKLIKTPKDFPDDHPDIELLKFKSYLAVHRCDDKTVCSADFADHCARVFKALYPFDQFLNRARD